ncbi:MAG: hypothetical protein E7337_10835 [Clostridiales bacterium]|nr:hypothetical protein [Clostridiales bacterium]
MSIVDYDIDILSIFEKWLTGNNHRHYQFVTLGINKCVNKYKISGKGNEEVKAFRDSLGYRDSL